MAEYGHVKTWGVHLTDVWLKKDGRHGSCWGTDTMTKGVNVPKPFLGLLIDGHRDGYERNRKYRKAGEARPTPRITWIGKRQEWRLTGGYHGSDDFTREWLRRNGWLSDDYRLIKPITSREIQLELPHG